MNRSLRPLRIISENGIGAVFVDRWIGWVWPDDIRRDPEMVRRIVEKAEGR